MSKLEPIAEWLRGGGIAAFPTETVYGLGASVWNPAAVRAVFDTKGRPADNPLIVHVATFPQLRQVARDIPEAARDLIRTCWPGPLTLVLHKRDAVPDIVSGGLPTVAVRMPDHRLTLELIRLAGPLVGPSANRSGRPSPTKAEHVRADFGTTFPILDGGPCGVGVESTVVDLTERPYRILRPGLWTAEALTRQSGVPIDPTPATGDRKSPGTRYTHYAPDARVAWWDGSPVGTDTLLVRHEGDLDELARRLYDAFREADASGKARVCIEPLPEGHPLTHALKDRIEKAMRA